MSNVAKESRVLLANVMEKKIIRMEFVQVSIGKQPNGHDPF
jgi:hypothetical protein